MIEPLNFSHVMSFDVMIHCPNTKCPTLVEFLFPFSSVMIIYTTIIFPKKKSFHGSPLKFSKPSWDIYIYIYFFFFQILHYSLGTEKE